MQGVSSAGDVLDARRRLCGAGRLRCRQRVPALTPKGEMPMSLFADILVLAALVAAAWAGRQAWPAEKPGGSLDCSGGPVGRLLGRRPPDGACGPVDRAPGHPAGGAEAGRRATPPTPAQMLQAFSFRGSGLQKMLDSRSPAGAADRRDPHPGRGPEASPVPWR